MSTRIRVGVADDDALVRHALAALLAGDPDIDVVWCVADGASAVEAASDPGSEVDVLLMDIRMPGMTGLDALNALAARRPELPVVMLTTLDTSDMIAEALNSGARGYFVKDDDPMTIAAGLKRVVNGERAFSPSASTQVVDGFLGAAQPGKPAPAAVQEASLTAREQQVLVLLAASMSNKQIAKELFVSEATVKTHVSVLISKLGVVDRVGAAVWAHRKGLI